LDSLGFTTWESPVPAPAEQHYTINELVPILKYSRNTLVKYFDADPAILRHGAPNYVSRRIPQSAVDRVLQRLRHNSSQARLPLRNPPQIMRLRGSNRAVSKQSADVADAHVA
jgi:hypothetical protein